MPLLLYASGQGPCKCPASVPWVHIWDDTRLRKWEWKGNRNMYFGPWRTRQHNSESQSTKLFKEIALAGVICNLWKATNCNLYNMALNLSRKVLRFFQMRHFKSCQKSSCSRWLAFSCPGESQLNCLKWRLDLGVSWKLWGCSPLW